MKPCKSLILAIIWLVVNSCYVAELAKVKFTNLQCQEFDRPFAVFKKCFLKAVARDTNSLNIHVQLLQLPITNITLNAQLFVKSNGYKPFLYNETLDFCKFLKKPGRNIFSKIVYAGVKPYLHNTNSCPVEHDVIIDNLTLNDDVLQLIPFPTSEYMIQLQFAAYNHYKAKVKVFLNIIS